MKKGRYMIQCACGKIHEVQAECFQPKKVLATVQYKDWGFEVSEDQSWFQVRINDEHKGRKWKLSPHMTKSEIVQTAFLAVLTAEEHETREQFKYRGYAIFGPHFNVDRLADLIHQGGAHQIRD
jgi:hypothetical protein